MDVPPPNNNNREPVTSTSIDPSAPSGSTSAIRSSARVKAAKDKAKEQEESASAVQSSSTKSKRARDTAKGKEIEPSNRPAKKARRAPAASAALSINEPVRDPKGKKRAIEPSSEPEEQQPEPSASTSSKTKRTRTSGYSLRSRTDISIQQPLEMPRKARGSVNKGKAPARSKGGSSSSRLEDEEDDMMDVEYSRQAQQESEDQVTAAAAAIAAAADDDPSEDEDDDEGGGAPPGQGEDAAMLASMFGDFQQFGSYMVGLGGRLKTMLNNIKMSADPTTRLMTLQELSELLSMSTEDTLAGSFQVEAFVRELVRILGGRGTEDEEEDDDEGEGHPEMDEDAALAAALAMSTGGAFPGDENLEAQVLACRCLANLMEALPGVAHTVVYQGAIPVLCSKLIEISYIDLAEQTLSTMEKISEEFPSAIVREGGLAALLNYLDFFSIAVQRTALQAASNCCRNVSADQISMIQGVWPIIRNCLAYSDQRLVEYACHCVIRVIDSYHRASVENLETLVDVDLIRAVNLLLLPAGGSPLIASNTYTLLLRALATSARASPKIALALLEADMVDTLYQILTGVLPSVSNTSEEQGGAGSGQGLGGGLADMTVMENLAHRPKDQIEEALSLVSELMPPLPKDGVFDHKSYTEKSLARLVKAKGKLDRAAARHAAAVAAGTIPPLDSTPAGPSAPALAVTPTAGSSSNVEAQTADSPVAEESQSADVDAMDALPAELEAPAAPRAKPPVVDRTALLRSKPVVVDRFLQLMVPILIDVYAASVITPVRVKTLTGLLKAISFLDAEGLRRVLTFVPVAGFASSILSSKDHPSLVIGALQLVDLLLLKVPTEYKPTFKREGVVHEIQTLADRDLSTAKAKEKAKAKETSEDGAPSDDSAAVPPLPVATSSANVIPGYKKLSSLSLEPEDAITLRARVIRFKHLGETEAEGSDNTFDSLRRLVARISAPEAGETELVESMKDLAALFASPHTSVSSFELLQSGVVDELLQFATDKEHDVTIRRRQEIILDAFAARSVKGVASAQTPFATFVKKLQESLTRMESYDVVTVAQGADDSKRSSPSLLARQLRLRLVATDDSEIPANLHNIVVSIHAIATFQALHDYLRPRVSGSLGGSSSRLSGMLAALAASGYTPSAGSRELAEELLRARTGGATSGAGTSGASAGASSLSAPAAAPKRRRSMRLAKGGSEAEPEVPEAPEEPEAGHSATNADEDSVMAEPEDDSEPEVDDEAPSAAGNAAAEAEALLNTNLEADFTDDEVDAEVYDDEVEDPDNSVSDKTVSLSVADDGSRVVAQTPDGTRVATPSAAKEPTRNPLSSRGSYAAAVKTKPTDWHLEFSMDDHTLPLDLTIYGAIHQHEMRKATGPLSQNLIWQGVYTIKFKKVAGPASSVEAGAEQGTRTRSPSPTLTSLPDDAPHAKIVRLLRVLHKLNVIEGERAAFAVDKRNLPDSAFVNNKLSAKLTRQLEEPMIVASSCLPDWAVDLPQHFPFLFPFATRYNFLQSTSFGYARLILKWQSQQTRNQDSSRRDDGIGFLGRLQRQKVRISRKHILESAVKVFELYGSSSSVLEVEYFEEVGTGLGPTLEFYSLVSREFARRDLKIWRDSDSTKTGSYVHHPTGLFPSPISSEDIASDGGKKRTHILRVIGQFVAKAMLDSRIIDLSFNKVFIKLLLGEDVPVTIASLKLIDADLASSLTKLRGFAQVENESNTLTRKVAVLEQEQVAVGDLSLDFTIPGYSIELRPDGANIDVTAENAEEYISEVLDAIVGQGAQLQAKAFREGFSKVFPISDLESFSADELVMLFGNAEEDWSSETLSEALKADHGFNVESKAIRDLVEIMSEYDVSTRRNYLQFITGSPKLPIGGFRGLNPQLTVVRKPHESPLTADDYLPSVMTCVNYLKLPEYSSKAVMKEKLRMAIHEGIGSFHLS